MFFQDQAPMPPMPPHQPQFMAGAPPAAAAQPTVEALLAVCVPGRPMSCSWEILGETRAAMVDRIEMASDVPEVFISLLPDRPAMLQENTAAIVYWTADGTTWSLLGAIALGKPSAMMRTGWGSTLAPGSMVQLAVSIEPMEVAMNLGIDTLLAGGQEERRNFARAIAKDLWTFLASFSQHAPMGGGVQTSGEMMLVPTNILDRWLERFDAKYQRDPNFMMKSAGSE